MKFIKIVLLIFLPCPFAFAQPVNSVGTDVFHKITKYYLDLPTETKCFINGFAKPISGSVYTYYSAMPDAEKALITRASDGKMAIEWESASLPLPAPKTISLIWLAGLGMDYGEIKFDLFVNENKLVTFSLLKKFQWLQKGFDGSELSFTAFYMDQYNDLFGFMTLTLPLKNDLPGKPLKLKVVGENANSSAWYMTFQFSPIVEQIRQTKEFGFWYQLNWEANKNWLQILLPNSLAGKSIKIQDQHQFILQDKLQTGTENSSATFAISLQKWHHADFPVSIILENNIIDQVDSLAGCWQATEYFDDGKIVSRSKGMNGNIFSLECCGDYFSSLTKKLKSLANSCFKNGVIHVVSSSHQDIAWMDSPQNCMVQRDTMIITPALEILRHDSSYFYSAEQMLMLKEYLSRHPERFDEIAQYTKAKRLEWGASFNQPYEGMYSGESLVRQFYFGRKWLKKIMPGCDSRIYWNLDVPARTLQMPQILKKSGVNYLLLSRHERGLFYWQSPDGSRVGAFSPGHYHHASEFLRQNNQQSLNQTPNLIQSWEADYQKYQLPPHLPVIYSSDMSRPQNFSDLFSQWNNFNSRSTNGQKTFYPRLPKFKYDTAEATMDQIFVGNPNLPVIQGERPNVWLYIHGPTHHEAISASRAGSRLLTAAEKFSTVAALLDRSFSDYPAKELSDAWEAHIYPDHGWGGKNGHITDQTFLEKSEFARDQGKKILTQALNKIVEKIQTDTSLGLPLFVFNELSWRRETFIRVPLVFQKGEAADLQVLNSQAEEIRSALVNVTNFDDGSIKNAELNFIASDVPGVGYKTFFIKRLQQPLPRNDYSLGNNDVYENSYFAITFARGGIGQIFDKELKQSLFRTDKFFAGELFSLRSEGNGAGEFAEVQQPTTEDFEKVSQYYPAWSKTADNEIAATFTLEQKMKHCDVQQRLIVYKQSKRIDFEVKLRNWDGTKYREFRLAFPLNMNRAKITYETPFGKVTVGEDEILGAAGERYVQPAHHVRPREVLDWINASDDNFGFTLSSSVAVCDYVDPTENPVAYPIIQPVLLASRKSCHAEGNWYLQAGDHSFRFSIFSHQSGWQNGYHKAKEINHPMQIVFNPPKSLGAFLPLEKSFITCPAKNVIISTLKKDEDNNAVILRCYEMEGKDTNAAIDFFAPIKLLEKTNLIEEEGKPLPMINKQINLLIGHHAIETIKIVVDFEK